MEYAGRTIHTNTGCAASMVWKLSSSAMTTLDSRVSLAHSVLNNVVRSVHSELNRKDSYTSVCHRHDLGPATVHTAKKKLLWSTKHVGTRSIRQSHSRTMFDVPAIPFGAKIKHIRHLQRRRPNTSMWRRDALFFECFEWTGNLLIADWTDEN